MKVCLQFIIQLHLIFAIRWLLFTTCYLWLAIWLFLSETCYYLQKLVPFARCCTSRNFSYETAHIKMQMGAIVPQSNLVCCCLVWSVQYGLIWEIVCTLEKNLKNHTAVQCMGVDHIINLIDSMSVWLTILTAIQYGKIVTRRREGGWCYCWNKNVPHSVNTLCLIIN